MQFSKRVYTCKIHTTHTRGSSSVYYGTCAALLAMVYSYARRPPPRSRRTRTPTGQGALILGGQPRASTFSLARYSYPGPLSARLWSPVPLPKLTTEGCKCRC
jgi:hypothetical protein